MHNNRLVLIASCLTMAVALTGAASLIGPINDHRQQLAPTPANPPSESLPWHITIAKATLGPLRGLGINFLWYRIDQLTQENRLFEANQLSQWITSLMPHYPRVWSFHAWNLAYNISVKTYTPQERWDWVNQGITLLRDKGIVYNPNAAHLYRELGWIFFHKLGQYSDDMHWYYKQQFASQWHELLGAPPLGASTQQVIDEFSVIPQTPDTIEQLLQLYPATRRLIDKLQELGYAPDETTLRQLNRAISARNAPNAALLRVLQADRPNPFDDSDPRLAQLLDDPSLSDALPRLLAFLRKKALRENYHMDPDFMLQLMKTYGPLDWRHPESHGVYWSELGLKMAGAPIDWARAAFESIQQPQPQQANESLSDRHNDIDLLNTNRLAIHSLQQLAWFGLVSFDPLSKRLDLLPDPRFIPAYDRAMDLAKQRIDSGLYGPSVSIASFEDGHENFLLRAMTDHYLYGDADQARYFFNKARNLYGSKPVNRSSGRYRRPMPELASEMLRQDLEAMANTNQFVRAMLLRAFEHGLAYNRLETFNHFVQIAKLVHTQYQKSQSAQPTTPQDRLKLLPFNQLLDETYLVYMSASQNLPDLLTRSRAWTNSPPPLKKRVYDRLLPTLESQSRQAGLDPTKAFPSPLDSALLPSEPAQLTIPATDQPLGIPAPIQRH